MTQTYAAVDLGSNSFHLLTVQLVDGEVRVIDRLKERVRLAAGLTSDGHIAAEARQRALDCLTRFGHMLSRYSEVDVRVVGTNTLRRDPSGEFLLEAERALGHPIQVISGAEEARLIYRGVSHDIQDDDERRLVIDIGGGSTECVIGSGAEIIHADSLYMGCVAYTQKFFADGRISRRAMDRAIVSARLEVGSVKRVYRHLGWSRALGSSGTINAVQSVLAASGRGSHKFTREDMNWLVSEVNQQERLETLSLPGLKPERATVFPGGLCILMGLFKAFKIKEMAASPSALREGVVYELIGRDGQTDVREATVKRMRDRYSADQEHTDRMEELILRLAESALPQWGIDTPEYRKILVWAAALHEIGKAVSYAGYHRHSAYLVANSDMVGFSREQQALLAAIILGQRRRLLPRRLEELVGPHFEDALRLTLLLRLASRLNRTRSPRPRPMLELQVSESTLALKFPSGWLEERPLTQADLEREAQYLSTAGFELTWT
jgi:exopolyphosphatase / guanosine-5'-triphosphate,3'-diphosphate pyrophosphatase